MSEEPNASRAVADLDVLHIASGSLHEAARRATEASLSEALDQWARVAAGASVGEELRRQVMRATQDPKWDQLARAVVSAGTELGQASRATEAVGELLGSIEAVTWDDVLASRDAARIAASQLVEAEPDIELPAVESIPDEEPEAEPNYQALVLYATLVMLLVQVLASQDDIARNLRTDVRVVGELVQRLTDLLEALAGYLGSHGPS